MCAEMGIHLICRVQEMRGKKRRKGISGSWNVAGGAHCLTGNWQCTTRPIRHVLATHSLTHSLTSPRVVYLNNIWHWSVPTHGHCETTGVIAHLSKHMEWKHVNSSPFFGNVSGHRLNTSLLLTLVEFLWLKYKVITYLNHVLLWSRCIIPDISISF